MAWRLSRWTVAVVTAEGWVRFQLCAFFSRYIFDNLDAVILKHVLWFYFSLLNNPQMASLQFFWEGRISYWSEKQYTFFLTFLNSWAPIGFSSWLIHSEHARLARETNHTHSPITLRGGLWCIFARIFCRKFWIFSKWPPVSFWVIIALFYASCKVLLYLVRG